MLKSHCNHNEVIFEKLDPHKHDRFNFDCGVENLNNFLTTFAKQQQEKKLSVTYVATFSFQKPIKSILGYYTISINYICFDQIPKNLLRGLSQQYPIPTIKLCRLARDKAKSETGFGAILLRDALYRCIIISDEIGIVAVDVDAKNDIVANFYKVHGFQELGGNKRSLIIAVKTLIEIFNNNKNPTLNETKELLF